MENNIKESEEYKFFKLWAERWPEDKYEEYYVNEAKTILPQIKECKNGYVVLKDGTIKCTPAASQWMWQFDDCTEHEATQELWAAIKGC